MQVLIKNNKTNVTTSFPKSMLSNLGKEWQVVKALPTKPDTIGIKEIKPNFNPSDYTVNEFRENLENFTFEQLTQFSKDKRQTIANEAKKQLNKGK